VALLQFSDPAGRALPPWEPGAHLELVLPSSLVRHYSLCGDPADTSTYTVAVLRVADGRGGSIEIHDGDLLGQVLTVRGPRNHFPLVDAPCHLLLAGGIGITPLSAMVRHLAGRGADWQLVYGGRRRSAMAFHEELAVVGGERVQIVAEDEQGFPDFADLLGGVRPGTAIYCCGPEAMIRHVQQTWEPYRDGTSLHIERFAPSGTALDVDTTLDRAFEIELVRHGVVLTVPADRSALDVVREVVPNHPYSCHAGECGSCEVSVLGGTIDHRDEVLSDDERASNECMMLCVSRALSARLVIDL
jgi:tetrachlorobenzoquinone reductase